MTSLERAPVFSEVDALRVHVEGVAPSRMVLTNGCFDPLHVGHVRYLADAAQHGDFLVVALNNDEGTRRLKGPERPVVGEADRATILAGLSVVDAVLLFGDDDVVAVLEALHPAVHAKGTDYTVETVPELETSKRLGIETVITGDAKSHASSSVLRQLREKEDP